MSGWASSYPTQISGVKHMYRGNRVVVPGRLMHSDAGVFGERMHQFYNAAAAAAAGRRRRQPTRAHLVSLHRRYSTSILALYAQL